MLWCELHIQSHSRFLRRLHQYDATQVYKSLAIGEHIRLSSLATPYDLIVNADCTSPDASMEHGQVQHLRFNKPTESLLTANVLFLYHNSCENFRAGNAATRNAKSRGQRVLSSSTWFFPKPFHAIIRSAAPFVMFSHSVGHSYGIDISNFLSAKKYYYASLFGSDQHCSHFFASCDVYGGPSGSP